MPPNNPKPEEEACNTCKKKNINKPDSKAGECDICQLWVSLKCSGVAEEVYNLADNLDFICKPCKEELPRIRDLIAIKQQQNEIQTEMRNEAQINLRFREKQCQTNQNLESRIEKIEQVVKNKKLDDKDFPPLSVWNLEKEKVKKVVEKQQELDGAVKQQTEAVKQQTEVQKEQRRRDDKEKNLIAYSIPEEHEDQTLQMKADYQAIKQIYLNRVKRRRI